MEMIPKNEMVSGCWYLGYCRNSDTAFWDGNGFLYLRYKFGWMWDTINHFEDEKDNKTDGFIPVQKLNIPELDRKELIELKQKVGY